MTSLSSSLSALTPLTDSYHERPSIQEASAGPDLIDTLPIEMFKEIVQHVGKGRDFTALSLTNKKCYIQTKNILSERFGDLLFFLQKLVISEQNKCYFSEKFNHTVVSLLTEIETGKRNKYILISNIMNSFDQNLEKVAELFQATFGAYFAVKALSERIFTTSLAAKTQSVDTYPFLEDVKPISNHYLSLDFGYFRKLVKFEKCQSYLLFLNEKPNPIFYLIHSKKRFNETIKIGFELGHSHKVLKVAILAPFLLEDCFKNDVITIMLEQNELAKAMDTASITKDCTLKLALWTKITDHLQKSQELEKLLEITEAKLDKSKSPDEVALSRDAEYWNLASTMIAIGQIDFATKIAETINDPVIKQQLSDQIESIQRELTKRSQ